MDNNDLANDPRLSDDQRAALAKSRDARPVYPPGGNVSHDDIDTSRLSDDQRRALELSREAPINRFIDKNIDRAGDTFKSVVGSTPGEAWDAAKSTASKYAPAAKEAALDVATAMGPSAFGAARAAYGINRALNANPEPPDGPSTGDWGHGRAPIDQTRIQQPSAQQGNLAKGMGGGGGQPTDWNAEANKAMGGNVSDAGVTAAQNDINKATLQQGDIEGLAGQNRAANSAVAENKNAVIDANQAVADKALNEHLDRLNNRASALEEDAMNGKVDQDRWMHNQSTGGKILAGLSVAFGAVGQAFNKGGSNVGLDMINKHIDNDIEEQREAIKSKKEGAHAIRGVYSELRQRGLDDAASTAKAKQMNLDKAARDSQMFADQLTDPLAKSKAIQGVAKFQKDAAEQKLEYDRSVARQAYAMHQHAQASAASARAAADKQAYDRQMKARDENREDMKTGIEAEKAAAEIEKIQGGPKGKVDPAVQAAINAGTSVGSTAMWDNVLGDPRTLMPGTQTGALARANDAWNGAVAAVAHKTAGARTPEAQEHIMGSFQIKPSDSAATIADKKARFMRIYGGMVDTDAASGASVPDEESDVER